MTVDLKAVAESIVERDFGVMDAFLETTVLKALRKEVLEAHAEGELHAAKVGKGVEQQRIQELRGDAVKWLNRDESSDALQSYWHAIDALRDVLSDFFRVHLERTEAHYTMYPAGAFYSPHLDQFRDQSNRIFSVILYLNAGWQRGDGGELRIHQGDGGMIDIEPLFGRLVCFLSDRVLHEVLPARKPRLSLTGWMRRDPFIL